MDQAVQFPAVKIILIFKLFEKFSASSWFPVKHFKLKCQSDKNEINRKSMCHASGPERAREYIVTLCVRRATNVTANSRQNVTAQVLLLKPFWGKDNTFHQVSVTLVSVVRLTDVHCAFKMVSQRCCCRLMCIYTTALGLRTSTRHW